MAWLVRRRCLSFRVMSLGHAMHLIRRPRRAVCTTGGTRQVINDRRGGVDSCRSSDTCSIRDSVFGVRLPLGKRPTVIAIGWIVVQYRGRAAETRGITLMAAERTALGNAQGVPWSFSKTRRSQISKKSPSSEKSHRPWIPLCESQLQRPRSLRSVQLHT